VIKLFTGIKRPKGNILVKQFYLGKHAVEEARQHIELCHRLNAGQTERFLKKHLKSGKLVGIYPPVKRGQRERLCYQIEYVQKGAFEMSCAYLLMEEKANGHFTAVTCLSADEFERDKRKGKFSPPLP